MYNAQSSPSLRIAELGSQSERNSSINAQSPTSSPNVGSSSRRQRDLINKEKKLFVYNLQRNEARLVRQDEMSETESSKLQPVQIPKGSRFVDVKLEYQVDKSSETRGWANVNIATVELPKRIRIERKFTGNYKHIWVT